MSQTHEPAADGPEPDAGAAQTPSDAAGDARAPEPDTGAVEATPDAAAEAPVPEPRAAEQPAGGQGPTAGVAGFAPRNPDPARRAAELAALTEAVRAVERRTTDAPSHPAPSHPASSHSAPSHSAPAQPGLPAATPAATPEPEPAAPRLELPADALRATVQLLTHGGAPAAAADQLAHAALTTLGEQAPDALQQDPWALLALPGVRPEQADGFAQALLGPSAGPGDPRRGRALAVWLLERAALLGHSALTADELRAGLAEFGLPDPDQAVQAAVEGGQVLPFQEEETGPGAREVGEDEEPPMRLLLALDRLAQAEEEAAEGLARLLSTFGAPVDAADPEVEPVVPGEADWEAAATAADSASAAALIRAVAAAPLVLHTGDAAARGELAALLRAARALGLRARAAAWTEYGRDALGEPESLTLAELLRPGTVERTEEGALALDLLIVQDAPLLDLEQAATLVEALADGTRLVLSGDPGQLWSAGPGRLFADLLAAKVCPQVASRTPDLGPIGELVSGIGVGELTTVEAPEKEVVIVTARESGEAAHRAVQLLTESIPRALGIPAEQTVLLTPGHGGPAGTRALNAAAKARLNPGPGRFGGFDPGDRVVYSPLPGINHPGRVLGGDRDGLRLGLADGSELVLPPARVDRLRHGWSLTVHQAAGRRWPAVVAVLPEEAGPGLTRQWVYTAFGRAERHLSVVHAAGPALAQAVAERPAVPRTTRLRALLAENAPQG
ncbi:ATP-binding domain-containing protein [Kitasatospora sp. RB6PN24]|uniref:ATP-binding domain-containing protein n=1 Tax=Kitasatospora humi TaxID=2893891 RepID=UPI001E3B93DD|nr:AAA family ATPase [Kitasatospora humi]MCC9307103.1 ATP-binding domain-containing protein [Kitasatospora humi]